MSLHESIFNVIRANHHRHPSGNPHSAAGHSSTSHTTPRHPTDEHPQTNNNNPSSNFNQPHRGGTVHGYDHQRSHQSRHTHRGGDTYFYHDEMPAEKTDIFIIFADLDGTFTPMDIDGKEDFVSCIKEIQEETGVHVKFVPISGRPPGYVLRVMHDTRDICQSLGITNICDYGAAEQGAVLVDSQKTYASEYTGHPSNKGLKRSINQCIEDNEYSDILADEPDKLYTCSIHIKQEAKDKLSVIQRQSVYRSLRNDIERNVDLPIDITMSHNSMEVMTSEISKPKAIDTLLWRYWRQGYNVVGILFAGDAENDRHAIEFVSKLAEIPGGMTAHVYEPSNAQAIIGSDVVEDWKNRNPAASKNRIKKGTQRVFRGITELIRKDLKEKRLVGPGISISHSKDDMHMYACPACGK